MTMKQILKFLGLISIVLFVEIFNIPESYAQAGRFENYEIRVIRERYLTKKNRFELGAQGMMIMNQTFIYTLMATGILDYHLSEMFAIELNGSYGFSFDKDDKRILDDEFDIKTTILHTKYVFSGGLLWTPIYGKTQLASGELMYFDTFLNFAAGMTGVDYDYEHCVGSNTTKPEPTTESYPTFVIGMGQKFFLDKSRGFRWDLKDQFFNYEQADGTCDPSTPIGGKVHHNITLSLGASKFF